MSDEKVSLDDIVRIQTDELQRATTLRDDGPHGLAIRAGIWKALFDDFMQDLSNTSGTGADRMLLTKLYQNSIEITLDLLNGRAPGAREG